MADWPEFILAHVIWQNWTKQCQVSCFQSSIIGTLTMPAHIKVYAFIFNKTHCANCQHKSSPLANREIEIFYFAFTSGLVHHSSYDSSALPEILPSSAQIFPCPLTLTFTFFISFFSFLSRLLTNQLKFKNSKK
jgi:hypothetical protein